jgi:hypothetical protein
MLTEGRESVNRLFGFFENKVAQSPASIRPKPIGTSTPQQASMKADRYRSKTMGLCDSVHYF